MRIVGLGGLVAALLPTALAVSPALGEVAPPPEVAAVFARMLQPGMQLDGYLRQARALFRMIDFDADGIISLSDLERHKASNAAAVRAVVISGLLRFDLDGDGVVTRQEIEEFETYAAASREGDQAGGEPRSRRVERAVTQFMQADLDHDGRIELSEMIALADRTAAVAAPFEGVIRAVLALDQDGDGTTSSAELAAAIESLFKAADRDGDGTVTREELDEYWRRLGQPRNAPPGVRLPPLPAVPERPRLVRDEDRDAECAMPAAPAGAKTMLVGAYTGQAVSSVALGSQDETTKAARVTIEPGPEPLYLVLVSANRMIWQFDGEVQRLVKVVLQSRQSAVGASGLAKEAVSFLSRDDCFGGFTQVPSTQAALDAAAFRRRTGRDPDGVVAKHATWIVSLPSGRFQDPAEVHFGHMPFSAVRAEFVRFNPGGVMQVDPGTVVSRPAATPYEVLPEHAGLIQLLESGALEVNRRGEFIVRKETRYPPGLAGSLAVRFLVPSGVPLPHGDPGHSCVVSEDAGVAVAGADMCR